jgi:hypothetical protein
LTGAVDEPLVTGDSGGVPGAVNPTEPAQRLFRDLRADRRGLSSREHTAASMS